MNRELQTTDQRRRAVLRTGGTALMAGLTTVFAGCSEESDGELNDQGQDETQDAIEDLIDTTEETDIDQDTRNQSDTPTTEQTLTGDINNQIEELTVIEHTSTIQEGDLWVEVTVENTDEWTTDLRKYEYKVELIYEAESSDENDTTSVPGDQTVEDATERVGSGERGVVSYKVSPTGAGATEYDHYRFIINCDEGIYCTDEKYRPSPDSWMEEENDGDNTEPESSRVGSNKISGIKVVDHTPVSSGSGFAVELTIENVGSEPTQLKWYNYEITPFNEDGDAMEVGLTSREGGENEIQPGERDRITVTVATTNPDEVARYRIDIDCGVSTHGAYC